MVLFLKKTVGITHLKISSNYLPDKHLIAESMRGGVNLRYSYLTESNGCQQFQKHDIMSRIIIMRLTGIYL